jgi:hypothetical protein
MTTIEEKDVIITKGKKKLIIRKPAFAQIQAPAVIQAPAPAPNKIDQYISQLSAQEKIVFKIAQEHLESSFDMEKSIGYKEWLLKNKN